MADFFSFKDRPLVKCGDTIFYGSMADRMVVQMTQSGDLFKLQLIKTDPSISPADAVVSSCERTGYTEALDIADIWLSRTTAN